MQQDAVFITADFLYMFRASCTHHQEYKILTRQPPVQVVMVAGGSSLRHIRDETVCVFRKVLIRWGGDISHPPSDQYLPEYAYSFVPNMAE
jgi:hypothetical protein